VCKLKKINVLIVDDSVLIQNVLIEILSQDDSINVVGTALDPYEAREKIKQLNPDVITLDIEMPKMDGLTFLFNLMKLRPMPVVMISSFTKVGAQLTQRALELGAVDFIAKPEKISSFQTYSDEIIDKVKAAAFCNINALIRTQNVTPIKPVNEISNNIELIAIGASIGGTEAIKEIMMALPTGLPPIVVAQHIPDLFLTSYAARLDSLCRISVTKVIQEMELSVGFAYLAPGDQHLLVNRKGRKLIGRVEKSEPVNRHRPSVDVLFKSVAQATGKRTLAIILTGMGSDGVSGLLDIKQAGGITMAQDEETSVVWGMPGKAVQAGAAAMVLPLNKIASAITRIVACD
jgi:two-component system chemotaxis response regulator CheB